MCWPLNWVSSWAAMRSGVCGSTAAPSCTQCWVPSFTYSRRRKCQTSVVVPTVDLRPPRDRRCSMATVGRNAPDGIHLGPARGLHDGARIGVQRFEVAALAFVEQDVKRQRGLARAGHARHHIELAARDVHAQALEVVLAGIDDFNGIFACWRFGRALTALF